MPAIRLECRRVFVAPSVLLALVATALCCVSSGILLAALIRLLIRRYAEMRGSVMGLNPARLNVGMMVGASVGGPRSGSAATADWRPCSH